MGTVKVQHYSFLTMALGGGEQLTPRPQLLYSWERDPASTE